METNLILDTLYGPARRLGGSGLPDDELIRFAVEEFKGRSFCIVRCWLILDVMLPCEMEKQVQAQSMTPTAMYASQIVFSDPSIALGTGVLTGYQQSFDACFFESKDTLYILAGRGARKHVSLPALIALQQSMGAKHHD